MVIGLRVQLGGLHHAAQVAAALETTGVPLRNEVSSCPSSAAFYDHVVFPYELGSDDWGFTPLQVSETNSRDGFSGGK